MAVLVSPKTEHCPAGSEWDSARGGCVACPVGFYRSVPEAGAEPEAGAGAGQEGACVPCPQQTHTTLSTGSTSSMMCNVKRIGPDPLMISVGASLIPGFRGTNKPTATSLDHIQLQICVRGGLYFLTSGCGARPFCHFRFWTGALIFSLPVADGCEAGYEAVDDGSECSLCRLGTYKPEHGPQPCATCPAGSDGVPGYTLEKGTTQLLDCIPVSLVLAQDVAHLAQ